MALSLDMARMQSTTTGTGATIQLNATVEGFVSFQTELQRALDDGVITAIDNTELWLAIEQASADTDMLREVGLYRYNTGSPPTVTRLEISQSTNSGAAIDLEGAAQIFSAPIIESVAKLDHKKQVLKGGAFAVSQLIATGNYTVDYSQGPLQHIHNAGAFTISAPEIGTVLAPPVGGSCLLDVINDTGAGAITFSGFDVGSSVGDTLTTNVGDVFTISIWTNDGSGMSGYRIAAHQ